MGDDRDMDALAEEVARHGSLSRAAKAIKVSPFWADFLWLRICSRLGVEQCR